MGSLFWFTVSLPAASTRPQEPAESNDVVAAGELGGRSQYRVLIAEDNPVNRLVTHKQLRSLGYEVDAVEDGFQPLEALDQKRYELLLMDPQMPQATTRLEESAHRRTATVIALTAHVLPDDAAPAPLETGRR
ncbi:MAG: response regulator [Acidobacteriota bacterium]|nr:response regulator [Acidobacteriota bacterium]